jgi:hypothetical protein
VRFVRQCATEGLLPLLFEAEPPPAVVAVLGTWRAFIAAVRHRVTIIERTIARLPGLLESDFILLKGGDVAFRLYDSPHLRPMTDVDVLVRMDELPRIVDRLAAHGFRAHYSRLTHFSRGNPDLAFDFGDVTVEIHHSLVHRSSASVDYESLWAARVRRHVAGVDAFTLSEPDALLATALSVAKDGMTGPLIRYLDVWLAIRRNPHVITGAVERAGQWRIANALRAVLIATSRFFGGLDLTALPSRPFFDRILTTEVDDRSRNVRRVPTPTRLWRKYWTLDGVDLRLRYFASISAAAAVGLLRRRELGRAADQGRRP